ncbi:MAG: bifunctional glutamate N-acetyltransferase/amino-acid acetyltransferase ArgJ [Candidatus Erginobacter occultus]|nr:bifunctional glutamate N-acetyltransferase/amino-acid acetyltransferase ArgJ [Candidatus Erginobacter occultus]
METKLTKLFPPQLPRGFIAGGGVCGIKKDGGPDLALLYSESEAAIAASFTTNRVAAAPVKLSREVASGGRCRAVIANSGGANAATGERGDIDARRMAARAAEALGIDPALVAVASTGRIGRFLPIEKIERGIEELAAVVRRGGNGSAAAAIMTTDTRPKEIAYQFEVEGRPVRIWGMAKGAGMIYLKMRVAGPPHATMFCFLLTDLEAEAGFLRTALAAALEQSFNRITVDADTSTNDTVILLANGSSEAKVEAGTAGSAVFREALDRVTRELAWMIVADGEGAGKFVSIEVSGAASDDDARRSAAAVANSPLFKCALYGETPNWGRLLAALGYSGAELAEDRIAVWAGDLQVVRSGLLVELEPGRAEEELGRERISLKVDLGLGEGRDVYYTCDFSPEYVAINKE